MLPDVWRNWKLNTVFHQFDAPIPWNLLLFSNDRTAPWHFYDQPYPDNVKCLNNDQENVAWAINKIVGAEKSAHNDDTKAVLMVFEEHYIGDIHQPLHTISRTGATCTNDRGGNGFCLKQNSNGRCTKNLHSVWDSGLGYLKPKSDVRQLANQLEMAYPQSQFATQLQDTNPADWAKTNFEFAGFIYSLPEYQKPSPDYYRHGQEIAKEQLALAGYRLAHEIELNSF